LLSQDFAFKRRAPRTLHLSSYPALFLHRGGPLYLGDSPYETIPALQLIPILLCPLCQKAHVIGSRGCLIVTMWKNLDGSVRNVTENGLKNKVSWSSLACCRVTAPCLRNILPDYHKGVILNPKYSVGLTLLSVPLKV